MTNFHQLNLPATLVQSLERIQILSPTPIQVEAIPLALEGNDILASAQTGTGKTIAYLMPLLVHLSKSENDTALILAPTRELALQIKEATLQVLGKKPTLDMALLIGGENINRQFIQLKKYPRLIIGTPGRIIDHLKRRSLKLRNTSFLVLDETDRMLDMGFNIQLQELCKYLPEQRQTLMFSATMPANITKLAQTYLTDPKRISVGSTTQPIAQIKQDIKHIQNAEKFPFLIKELDERKGSIIVFVKTKRGADDLAEKLNKLNYDASALHGDLKQQKRERVIHAFRMQKRRIMVATDVAARGLDIPHVEHVVNYDLPQCPEDYIHRIGRTGRAGAKGQAISLITPQDGRLWKIIHQLMNPGAKVDFPISYKSSGKNFKKRDFEKKSFGEQNKPKPKWKRSEKDNDKPRPRKRFTGQKPKRPQASFA